MMTIFFGSTLEVVANQSKIDSLHYKLLISSADTNKVWILRDLAFYHLEENLDSTLFYSQKGYVLARNLNFVSGQIWNLYQKALALEFSDDFNEAMSTYRFALDLAEESNDLLSVAKLKNAIGAAYYYNSDYALATLAYQEAKEISEVIHYNEGLSHALNNLGIIYSNKKNYSKALEAYERSLSLKLASADTIGIINSNYNIGLLYAYLQEYDKSLNAFRQAKKLNLYTKTPRDQAVIQIGEGVALYHLGALEEAFELLDKGISMLKSDKSHEKIAALAYLGMLKIKKGEKTIGLQDLLQANEMVALTGRLELQKQVTKELASAYELLGQADQAVHYWKIYDQVKDSINSEQRLWAFEEMQAKYELIEKEKLISKQKAALYAETKSKLTIITGFSFLFLLTIYLGYRIYFLKLKPQKRGFKPELIHQTSDLLDFNLVNSHLPTPLTCREWDVVQLVELGKSNSEIAASLFVSENTVKTHLKNIFIKVEAQNRTDMIHKVRAMSLILQ
ncbi:tetratricopeptide repeat protein [Belliella buryatensis]|nr:tetratricopeptide repeat protein [Belliella buryatensis]